MTESSDMASLWSLVTVLGPILLLAVLSWAIMRNRLRTKSERDVTEDAPRDLFERPDQASKARDAD